MKFTRSKPVRFVPLVAVAVLGLAACGSSDNSSDSATTDAPAATAGGSADTTPAATAPDATTPADTISRDTTPAATTPEAAPSGAAGLQLLDTDLGSVLGDSDGFTVYIFMPDAQGDSTCYDACEANWPFVAEAAGVGEGLDASLLGTTQRSTGESQATYNGWPLYSFGGDSGPGETNGQGVGGSWYVIDATGTVIDSD